MRVSSMALAWLTGVFLPACALFSKGEPGVLRYFSLDGLSASRPLGASSGPAVAPDGAPKLRLGRVTGLLHLEERLVARDATHELEFSSDLRWSEPPAETLKRMLARVLFEERGLSHVLGGGGPTLDVELTALDERRGSPHVAQAEVVARLHDDRQVLWEETVTVEVVVVARNRGAGGSASGADADLVEALGAALESVVGRVADRVVAQLSGSANP